MKNQEHITCDLLVIGRGFAGMTAAARASSLGLKTVQAGSSAGFFLHSGLVDLLGVYPIEEQQILKIPEPGFNRLKIDIPAHPYAKVSYGKLIESLSFISSFLNEAGLEYQQDAHHNQSVLTAAGTFKPSFLIPKTFSGSNVEKIKDKHVLFVDFKGLKGYSARQLASVLYRICPDAAAMTIKVPDHSGDITPVALANMFEKDDFLKIIADAVHQHPGPVDRVGFPAVCGINNSLDIHEKLQQMIGCPCFEIPGLPPSIPGMRLRNAFEHRLSEKNVLELNNSKVSFNSYKNHIFFMTAATQNTQIMIQARGVILATGRFQGEGLFAKRGKIKETVFDLPVDQPEKRNQWYDRQFFTPQGHGINRAGLLTNERFQPLDENKAPRFDHLYAAGSILSHNDWMRLKSGAGVSCVSAIAAVDCFFDALKGDDHV